MASNAQKGSRYKAKTKKWLEARGYQVAHLEAMRFLFRQGQRPMAVKYDQFGADLLAVSARNVIFVQVKGGDACLVGHFPEARRKFGQFTFPPWVRRWVIAWPTGAREPRIVKMEAVNGEATTAHDQIPIPKAQGAGGEEAAALGGVARA